MGLKIVRGNGSDGGYVTKAGVHISLRELEALRLSALGLDNREAAEQMGISVNTYRNHVWGLMKKMGASNRANALLIAFENDMVEAGHHKHLLGWTPDEWLHCWKCHRVFPGDKALEVDGKQVVVDHVSWMLGREYVCPYEGCGAVVWASHEWSFTRQIMPEFPEVPKMGKVYEIDWSRTAVEETEEEMEERMKETEEQEKRRSRGK